MPRLMSVCVVVSLSHLTKYASRGVVPWNAPCRNRLCMNAPTLSRICAHSGSSLGSNTTHCVPAVEALLEEQRGAPHRDVLPLARQPVGARAGCARPRPRGPAPGTARRQLTPSGLSWPFSPSVSGTVSAGTPSSGRLEPGRRLPDAALARRCGPSRRRPRRPRRRSAPGCPAAGWAAAAAGRTARRSC